MTRALNFGDADRLLAAIEQAFKQADAVDKAVAEYRTARKALVYALKHGRDQKTITTLYLPAVERKLEAIRKLHAISRASERVLVSEMQDIELAVFGEVFTYSVDR